MIKLYSQLLQETTRRFSSVRKSDEPNVPLGRSLRTKEEEYDLLKVCPQNYRRYYGFPRNLIFLLR